VAKDPQHFVILFLTQPHFLTQIETNRIVSTVHVVQSIGMKMSTNMYFPVVVVRILRFHTLTSLNVTS
jgi:hypothetical protein